MAVEATNLNLFPPQLIQNRDMMNSCNQTNAGNLYSSQQQMFFPAMIPSQSYYQLPAGCDSLPHVNTDSGITCNIPTPPRKRQRDSMNDVQFYATPNLPQKYNNSGMIHQLPSFVADEILPQMKQHHFEIDTIISHHTKRIRLALDERLKQHARLLTAAIEQGVAKKLKEKDEQITKMGRINVVLQERLKSLYVENQLWRDLAQSNEATANSLRSDLEHVIRELPLPAGGNNATVEEDDAESCCGSSGGDEGAGKDESNSFHNNKLCRRCGEKDSCVLLLPCRHLCLCDACGAALQSCPVCQANVTATLHVNLSSS